MDDLLFLCQQDSTLFEQRGFSSPYVTVDTLEDEIPRDCRYLFVAFALFLEVQDTTAETFVSHEPL